MKETKTSTGTLEPVHPLWYEGLRTAFAYRPNPGIGEKFLRPALMSISGSMIELPYAMFLLNIKNNIIEGRKGIVPTTHHILASEGYKGFFRGTMPEIGRQVGRQCFRGPYMALGEPMLKKHLPPQAQPYMPVIGGISLACVEVTGTIALEGFKTYRTTEEKGQSKKPFKPFQGYQATLARQGIAWVLLFTASDALKKEIETYKKAPASYGDIALAAPLVSASFIIPPHPFDVAKTLQQGAKPIQGDSSIQGIWKTIVAKEGIAGLWKGCLASTSQRIPAAFIIMAMQKFYADNAKNSTPIKPATEIGDMALKKLASPIQKRAA